MTPEDPAMALRNYLSFLRNCGFLCLVPRGAPRNPSPENYIPVLESEREKVCNCRLCPLARNRTNAVYGEGNPQASLMFIGEAPGADEDLQGRPFVGKAGKLLDSMMQKAGVDRKLVYITNGNKCRPPGNRDPEPEEVAACRPYLIKQIETIRPKVIVALGRFAAHSLAGHTTPITKMRGNFFEYCGVRVMPTIHPSALFHNPTNMPLVIADIATAAKEAGMIPA